MKNRLLFLLKNTIHFLWVSLAAGAMTAETFLVFGQKIRLDLVVFIGLATLFGYHFLSKKMIFRALGWAAGIGAAVIFFVKKWPLDASIFGVFLLHCAYYFPRKNFAARAFTFGKPFVISAVWVICTVLISEKLIFKNQLDFDILIYERFFFVAALAIASDLVDFSVDSAAGLRTIPVRFGKKFARNLACLFLLVTFVLACLNAHYDTKNLVAMAISLAASGFLIQKLTCANLPKGAKIWVDSMMILQFLLVLIG